MFRLFSFRLLKAKVAYLSTMHDMQKKRKQTLSRHFHERGHMFEFRLLKRNEEILTFAFLSNHSKIWCLSVKHSFLTICIILAAGKPQLHLKADSLFNTPCLGCPKGGQPLEKSSSFWWCWLYHLYQLIFYISCAFAHTKIVWKLSVLFPNKRLLKQIQVF